MHLTCSVPWACERGTPPILSWTSAALTSLGPRTHLSSVLTLTPRPHDLGTNLTCQVQFPAAGVTVERTIQLNVTCECWARSPGSLRVWGGRKARLEKLVLLSLGKERGHPNPPTLISKMVLMYTHLQCAHFPDEDVQPR
uniref:Ig-like domain-containing protein n=1 Tax=Equus asinus asinus TaxID=83772 RepID=A0A8C4PKP8_EQUAS